MLTRKMIVGMILAVLVCCMWAVRGVDFSIEGNRDYLQDDAALLELEAPVPQPSYKDGEVIVKFKEAVADSLEKQSGKGKAVGTIKLSPSLEKINRKYKVSKIKPIIKNFKAKRQRMKDLVKKDKATLTKREKHLLRRQKRAPKGAKVPDLGRIYKIELGSGQSAPQAVAEYKRDPDVEYAELNYIVSICATPNDPNYYPEQWALHNDGSDYPVPGGGTESGTDDCDIDAPEAWDIQTGHSNVIVAVLDTGIDYNHPDLAANMWTDANGCYGYDFVNDDNNPMDDFGHGTHCAGTIAADGNNGIAIAGVCWDANIMALKFLDSDGYGSTDDAIAAIEYAVENGADIISNSWGSYAYSRSLEDAVIYAYSHGVVMVASAGNDNTDTPSYPAGYEYVMAIAATDSDDAKASFSNYGDWIEVAAPGADILSLHAAGTDMYGDTNHFYPDGDSNALMYISSGTSMACPHVAGLAALCLAEEPNLTPGDIRILISYYVESVDDPDIGSGRINAYHTLYMINSFPGPSEATNPYPDPNSTQQSIHLHLSWTAHEFASMHDVYLGTDFNAVNDANTTDPNVYMGEVYLPTFAPNNLDPNTTYYWRIDEKNITSSMKGYVWNFTTRGGDTIYVDINATGSNDGSSWANAYNSLEDALCIAWDDQVWVAEGTYKPDSNDRSDTFALMENTKLYGGFAGTESSTSERDPNLLSNVTVLSGDIGTPDYIYDNCYHVVTGNDGIVIDRFTIKEGCACYGGSFYDEVGGGMFNYGILSISITDCTFSGNLAYYQGGGIYSLSGELTLSNCIFSENSTYYYGGGIYCFSSSPTISNCTFSENSAYCGGGIYCFSSSPTISNCIFSNNLAGLDGGGIYNYECGSGPTLINCTFSGNSAVDYGGGIYNNCSGCTLTNCIVYGNTATDGGGIHSYYSDSEHGITTLTNCTFSKNAASDYGGGMFNYKSTPIMTNCILWADTAGTNDDEVSNVFFSDPNISYCDIEGCKPDGEWDPNFGNDLGGNIDQDPCFVNADANDFHLDWDTPCINAGDPNGDYTGQTDIDGDPRVIGSRVDMGSDESSSRVYNVTQGCWYPTIQAAIDDANDDDTVVVTEGRYYEIVDFNGVACTLTSTDPNDRSVVEKTIIDVNGASYGVHFHNSEDANSVLRGFTVTKGDNGVYCDSASPTISNCIIEDHNYVGVYCYPSSATIENCVIKDNGWHGIYALGSPTIRYNKISENDYDGIVLVSESASVKSNWIYDNGDYGVIIFSSGAAVLRLINNTIFGNTTGIYKHSGAQPTISNCILWGNDDDLYDCTATYSCIENGDGGTGNISSDPCFANADINDFHLNPNSPCIDVGDPYGDYDGELDIDFEDRVWGYGVDIGADENPYRVNNVTQGRRYMTIQGAIDEANDDDTVVVLEGTYYGTVDFNGVACTLTSTDPNDWDVVEATIIDANGASYGVYFHNSEDANSLLTGFTITNGVEGVHCDPASPTISKCIIENHTNYGLFCDSSSMTIENCVIKNNYLGGIYAEASSSPTIRYNTIFGSDYFGIFLQESSASVKSNLIYDNGLYGVITSSSGSAILRNNTIVGGTTAGIYQFSGTQPSISNCILWDNVDDLYDCTATYSCIEDCDDAGGAGNICGDANDPLFVDDANDNFHLDPNSPCIDIGDSNGDYDGELDIDGQPRVMVTEVDIGADEAAYLPTCHPDYNEWIDVGKPACWCYQRQCRGDTDGLKYSDPNGWFYVGQPDLDLLIDAWLVKEPPDGPGIGSVENGICADFAHDLEGNGLVGYYRVGPSDLNILIEYWKVLEPPDGNGVDPNCLECE